jgi:UDP-galactopyranose mutase
MLHTYGPHLFHTNDAQVWNFLSRFTEWTDYRHKVVADTRLGRIAIPYNIQTDAQLGRRLSDVEIRDLIFVDYSQKQWGVPWAEMPAAITGRVPTRRENDDHRYFSEGVAGTSSPLAETHVGRMPTLHSGETIITREYPQAHDETNEPYYPMPFGEGMALYQNYKALADAEPRTIFLGRLATYSYLDMWMAVAQALVKLRSID